MANPQYVYHMSKLSKAYPGGKKVLKDISLSFFPGAKIGVVGLNGAGKSTLLQDHGRARSTISSARPGPPTASRSAICRRSRSSIPTRTCSATSWRASRRRRTLLDHFNELRRRTTPTRRPTEMAELQDEIDAQSLWDLDTQVEMAMDALRCPPGDADVDKLSGGEKRRVALCRCCCPSPTCCCSTSRPTISTPKSRRVAGELPQGIRRAASILVTHDRYFLDNVTDWMLELDRGQGIPYKGNYSTWLEQKAKRLEQEGRRRKAKPAHLDARAGMDPVRAQGAPGQVARRAIRPTRSWRPRRHARRSARRRSRSPPGPRLGDLRHRGRGPVARHSATGC